MIWHPPFNATVTTILVVGAVVAMAASFLWSRRHLDVLTPQGMTTLGLRAAGFLLILYFLLQPSRLPTPEKIVTQRTLVVMVDSSASMSEPQRYGSRPTRYDAVLEAIEQRRVIEQIGEKAKLSAYSFAEQVTPTEPAALQGIKPTGRATDLSTTIDQTARLHANDDLTGVLIFTDGRNTQGSDPVEMAKRLGVPLYFAAFGEPKPKDDGTTEERKDLAVDAVNAQPRLVLGRSGQVAVSVHATGYGARQVKVELLEDDRPIGSTAVAVNPQQPKRQALFAIKPSRIGQHTYQVRIPAENDEVDAANNMQTFTVDVVDPVNRLLYLDRLRQERRFLKRVVDLQRNIRYAAVAQLDEGRVWIDGNDTAMKESAADLSQEQLRRTKAILIGDVPASALTPEKIAAIVSWVDEGGALLVLAGPESLGANGFGSTELAKLLPVSVSEGARYVEGEFPVQLTRDGAAHPAFQKVRDRWQNAPPLISRFDVASVKPAATVLLSTNDVANAPVVVSQNYGHGKVAIVLSDTTWRWQLGYDPAQAQRGEGSQHEVLWKQLIDWAMPELQDQQAGDVQVQAIADRVSYEVGDEVTMIVSVRDAGGATPANTAVELTIASPDGRPIQRNATLQPLAGSESEQAFIATFEAFFAGEYQVQAVAKVDNQTAGADQYSVKVVQPVLEFANTDPDRELLRALATASGGKYLDGSDLDDLASIIELEPREVTVQPNAERDAKPAWDRWWLLLAFAALMGSEWFIRRRNQWV
jgi:hypothetical protein